MRYMIGSVAMLLGILGCGTGTSGTSTLPAPYSAVYNVKSISADDTYVIINTADLPDHKSPFYGKTSASYEAYNGTNPNFSTSINLMGMISDPTIAAQDITFRLPKNPTVDAAHTATSGGAIGIAINGVVLFNQYNGVGALLNTLEFNNLDQYNGHPTPAPSQQYHYHTEPTYLTKKYGTGALIGFLLDGFPVYGPVEKGARLTTAQLDKYHGHEHATTEYPNGIYHYHITDDAPWINGGSYYGKPGTVTR